MHTCIVCTNSSPRTRHLGYVTYHTLPSDPLRRKKWIQSLKIKNVLDWHRVCSYHFTDDDYIVRDGCKRKLKETAIPSSKIVVTQGSDIKPEFVARLRRSLRVVSDLVYPEDPVITRKPKKSVARTVEKTEQTVRKTEQIIKETMQTVEGIEKIEQTVEGIEKIEQTVEGIEKIEQTVEEIEKIEQTVVEMEQTLEEIEKIEQTVIEMEQTVEGIEKTEQTVVETEPTVVETEPTVVETEPNVVETKQTMVKIEETEETEPTVKNTKVITPRRSTRKIKIKRNDDEIVNNLVVQSRKKKQKDIRDKNISTPQNPSKKSYYAMGIGIKCQVKNCQNRYSKNTISFFGFPNDTATRSIWIRNCGLYGVIKPVGKLKSTVRICRNHFEDRMFLNPDRPKRLRQDAYPTLFDDDVIGDTSQSTLTNHENMNMIIAPCTTNDGMDSQTNSMMKTDTDNEHSLNESRANELSSIYGVKLTTNSTLCRRHFVATDTNESKNSLGTNCAVKTLKTYKNTSKRSITNNDSNDLTIKKTKNNSSDELNTTIDYKSVNGKYVSEDPLFLNTIPNELFMNTSVKRSEARSSFDEALPKVLGNNSLSVSLNSLIRVEHYSGSGTPIVFHYPEDIEKSKSPKKVCSDSLSITSSSDESIPISLQSKFKEIILKSRSNKPVTISFEKKVNSDKNLSLNVLPSSPNHSDFVTSPLDVLDNYLQVQSEQVSAIDSTKTINSTVDDTNKLECIKVEPVDDLIPTTSTDNVQSDFCEPNFNKNPPLTSTISAVPETKESSVKQLTEQKSLTVSNINIKSEPLDTIDDESQTTLNEDYLSNNFQSNAESTLPTTSNVNYMADILQINTNESISRKNTRVSTNNCTKKVDSSRPISVYPSTSGNNSITISEASKFEQLLLNSSSNGSLSITVHPGHQPNVSNASANCSLVNTSQSNYNVNGQQSTANSRVKDKVCSNNLTLPEYINKQVSIIKPALPNKKRLSHNNQSVDKNTPVILNCVSLNSNQNRNNEYKQAILLINEIAKSIVLPGNLWRHHVNIKSKAHRFMEVDENMKPIKKIHFYKSLVPDININGKSFEYYEEIRTPDQLENLLDKIDEIEICWGYDGLHHEQCIAYFEDTSEETELCHNCKILMTNNSNFSEDALTKSKMSLIKELQNQVFELETRVAQAKKKKKMQMQKREDLGNILKAINPFKVLNALKPPAYIN